MSPEVAIALGANEFKTTQHYIWHEFFLALGIYRTGVAKQTVMRTSVNMIIQNVGTRGLWNFLFPRVDRTFYIRGYRSSAANQFGTEKN